MPIVEIDDDALEAARMELRVEINAPMEFTFACTIEELPKNCERGKVVVIEDREIAIFNIDDAIYATSNICPHEMSPILAAGTLDCAARTIACPLHNWIFDIPTGQLIIDQLVGASGSIPIYDVKLAEGEVWVREKEK
jgi:nitrite reductase/ring-hydroxylating ferredoxin subunit